jgi:diadenosine tetraphosphatase ApaH/serine/threonine PP2A family protein phosphatase
MRVAVISDIHANFHALAAVAEAIEQEEPDEIWCVGDVVGYGPQPNPCCDWTAEHAAICLAGNHDLGVLGRLDLAYFSDDAAVAALWTREVLSEEAREYLAALEPNATRDGVALYHASPRDPVWEYILSYDAARDAIENSVSDVTIVGHSHVPLAIGEGEMLGGHAGNGTEVELTGRWLLNPGSVGQPRDGDPQAAWLLLDLGSRRATFNRVSYDVGRTQAEIRELGLPDVLAERLAHGV